MRYIAHLAAFAAAAMVLAAPANAAFQVTAGETETIQNNNNFKSNLNAAGRFNRADKDTVISLTAPGTYLVELLAYENGYTNSFSLDGGTTVLGGVSWSGTANLFGTPLALGTGSTAPSAWAFDSLEGIFGALGSKAFGVFTPRHITEGETYLTSILYLGFDDQRSGDDNHDDGILRVSLINRFGGAVPEPATWAMLIAGFGMVGAAARRNRGATTVNA